MERRRPFTRLRKGKTYTLDLSTKAARRPHTRSGSLEADRNIFFDEPPRHATSSTLRRLILPRRPNRIKTLQSMTLEQNFVHRADDPDIQIPAKVVGLIHVFTFDLYGSEPPSIDLLPKWQPLPGIDASIANLHVFADPPSRMTPMRNGQMSMQSAALHHPTQAFNALLKLTSPKAVARSLNVPEHHSASLQFQFPAGEVPLVDPSDHKIVKELGLRQIELVSLAISNLLPRDAYKVRA